MKTIKIFLASSSELLEDRKEFEIFVNRRNKDFIKDGIFLELVIWEDFLDFVSQTRLQDEYNKALKQCELFVMLFYTKVGKYTREEFDTAYNEFKTNQRPLILTYFKDAPMETNPQESLKAFKDYLGSLGHFYTVYNNIDRLKLHFWDQLEKLEQKGFFGNHEQSPTQEDKQIANEKPKTDLKVLRAVKMDIANGKSVSKILAKYTDALLNLSSDEDLENALLLLQGKAKQLEKEVRLNLIKPADESVEQSRINKTLLDILRVIKAEHED